MYKRIFILLSSITLISSCEDDPLRVNLENVERETRFHRFEEAFFKLDTSNFEAELIQLKDEFEPFFLGGNTLQNWELQRRDEQQLHLYEASRQEFGKMEDYNAELNLAMKHFYYYFPSSPKITYYSYISNLDFNYPILFADTLCFAALDLYLGSEKEYYAMMPRYLAYYRQPKFLVRDCMEGLSQNIIPSFGTDEKSLLEWMIFYGKQLYFLEAMMPDKPESLIIKYTEEDLGFCQKNERNIWAYFIENSLLFRTGTELEKRFIDPAPFSKFGMQFDSETPGRIGQWLGWQIVRSYAENNDDATLQDILKHTDARKFLKESGYKPQ